MRILFIPYFNGGKSHQIPLYVLYQRYFSRIKNISTAFLLPASDHMVFNEKNIKVLDIDYGPPAIENNPDTLALTKHLVSAGEKAIKTFHPDIIVEDLDFFSDILSRKYMIPRISIKRTGLFRSSNPLLRNMYHVHSMERNSTNNGIHKILHFKEPSETDESTMDDENYYLPEITSFRNLPNRKDKSSANIIPGIPTIETLPPIKNRKSYFYCGPLNVKDQPSEILAIKLKQFLDLNYNRKKVFVTMGLIEKQNMTEMLTYLLDQKYAVITTLPYERVNLKANRLFINSTLPLDYTCSAVDLVVHHCGSGMYHYPIMNEKPVITIGTGCYDREDVALQLQALGLSSHTPSPQDDPRYLEVFKLNLERFEKGALCNFNRLKEIKQEIIKTMLSFDVEKVIDYTLNDK